MHADMAADNADTVVIPKSQLFSLKNIHAKNDFPGMNQKNKIES